MNKQTIRLELKEFRKNEKLIVAEILERLEIYDSQMLYMPEHGSMFDYCKNELGYSDAETRLRLEVMRLSRSIPEIKDSFLKDDLSASQVSLLSKFDYGLKNEDVPKKDRVETILSLAKEMEGKSVRASEDIIRKKKGDEEKKRRTLELAPEVDLRWKKFRYNNGHKSDSEALSVLLDLNDQKKQPSFKKEIQNGRVPTPGLRATLLKKAGHQCEFIHQGKRCSNHTNLQIDHEKPWALGGKTEFQNLQVLCPNHNQYKSRTSTLQYRRGR